MKKILMLFILIIFLIPIKVEALEASGSSAILMDQDSGRVLYNKNINEPRLIASITKIMTAVVAIESNQLNDNVTVSDCILKAYGSSIYLQVGEEISLRDLVYGLMLRSGNDAALVISEHLAGSEEKFVKYMNEKAREIGMKNSIFYNASGLDEKQGNISTAYDMAILMKYANNLSDFRKIVGTKKYITKTTYKTYAWANKNKLLRAYKYTTGGKTGFTERAGRTLVTSATRENMNLIVVTLNDPNDWTDHKNLYEYGFNNYINYRILNKNKFEVVSNYYKEELYIKNNYFYPLKENEKQSISVKVKLEKLRGYHDNDKVGEAEVYYKNKVVHREPVYVNIKTRESHKNIFQKIWDWFKL